MLEYSYKNWGGILPGSSVKKLSLPLPEDMHSELFDESRRTGVPATKLARAAIEDWLRRRKRERRREEIRRFATRHAGGEYDLNPVFESAAAEELSGDDGDDRETR